MFPKFLNPIEVLSIHELGLGAIVSLIFWPLSVIVYFGNVCLRFLSQLACNYYYPGRYKIADGVDSVFGVKLHGSSKSYIQGFKIIRGNPDIELIRSKFLQVFTKTDGFDKLKYVMTHKYGYFCWDTKVPFDLTKHIRLLDDFDPEDIVDEDRLIDICSQLVSKEPEEDKPQWEIFVIPKYRVTGEPTDSKKSSHYALIVRLHHAYCDGISFVLMTNNFLADVPGELPIDPTKGFNNAIWIKAYIWTKIFLVGPMNFFKNLAILLLSPSRYRVERYLKPKVLARSSQIDMEVLKRIRVASGTSVTSITIAAVFSALYKTHLRIFPGKPVPEKLHLGSIGVMLPYSEDKRLVNQFTMMRYTSKLKVDNPKERLAMTHEEVRKCASQPDPVFNYFMQRALGALPKFLHEILFSLSGTPVMLSNVPGLKTSIKMFGGELVDVTGWIPLVTTTGIGLSTQSYCGKIRFSAIVDPQIFPNSAELRVFLEDIVNEIHVLADAYTVCDSKPAICEVVKQADDNEGQPAKTVHVQNHNVSDRDVNDNESCASVRSTPQTVASAAAAAWLRSPSTTPTTEVIPIHCRNRKEDRGAGRKQINVQMDVRQEISI